MVSVALSTKTERAWLGWDIVGGLVTANTFVYLPGEGIALNEPSIVAVDITPDEVPAVEVNSRTAPE